MPKGVYDRRNKIDYIQEIRNSLISKKFPREALQYVIDVLERMPASYVRRELILLEYDNSFHSPRSWDSY